MKYFRFYEYLIEWLHSKLTERQFLIFSSALVGTTTGLVAVVLKYMVHYINYFATNYKYVHSNWLHLAFPTLGILIVVFLTNQFWKKNFGKGVSSILVSISRKLARLPKHQMYSHVITSAFTIGLGGSAGLESPIVTTGSAIGSNYSRTYHIVYKYRVLLLACGAAAGISALFNAPIAGVLFALEVLLIDIAISSFIPLIMSSAMGALCSKIILNEGIIFSFDLKEPFSYYNTGYYILLGVLTGFVSVYYSRMYSSIEEFMSKLQWNRFVKVFAGGCVLALLILLFPSLYGEGYNSISVMANNLQPDGILDNSLFQNFSKPSWLILFFVLIVALVKVIATAVTIGSGGNGGNFAPSLFVGAHIGFFFSRFINMLGISKLPESNFTIVAMCGILTGVFYAPLTGIFLIAEVTGGYELMIPLMIVSATSFTLVKYYEPLSMDMKKLKKKGIPLPSNIDQKILSNIRAAKLIETDFKAISVSAKLGDLIALFSKSHRNVFPVLNEDGMLVGIIGLDDIREIMFKEHLYNEILVKEIMSTNYEVVYPNDRMDKVMVKFKHSLHWNLPVVEENGKYLGFVSKSHFLDIYRRRILKESE